jgi:hypothetical protein
LPIPELTVEETISVLKKTSLFNIVVEGRDDIVAFRVLERKIHRSGKDQVSLIAAGGRDRLLQIYEGMEGDPALSRCVFICDMDTWVLSGVPHCYRVSEILLTDGYSIENDLLGDYPPEYFMDSDELQTYQQEIDYFSQWFTLEVSKVFSGQGGELRTYPGTILDLHREELTIAIKQHPTAPDIYEIVKADPIRIVRGKSVLQIAMRQLARKGRVSKHHHLSFLEHSANAGGANFSRITDAVLRRV